MTAARWPLLIFAGPGIDLTLSALPSFHGLAEQPALRLSSSLKLLTVDASDFGVVQDANERRHSEHAVVSERSVASFQRCDASPARQNIGEQQMRMRHVMTLVTAVVHEIDGANK